MGYKIHDNEENQRLAEQCFYEITHGKNYSEITELYGRTKSYWYELMKFYKKKWGFEGMISKYHWLKHTGEIKKVIDLYEKERKTTEELGKIYNVSDATIASWLRKENIEIRSRGYESRTRQNLFLNINTEIQAYVIGLITADGSITKNNCSISICLTQSDSYLLEQINEQLLGGTGNIIISPKKEGRPTATLQFHGKKNCEQLNEFNIVHRKSYSLTELSDKIPKELYHHYIRGLFDGNGVCSKSKDKVKIGYCAYNKEFTQSFRDFLNKELNFPKNKLFNTGGCWQVSWSARKDLYNFYHYIYDDATIFLGRKKAKMLKGIENYNSN